MPAVLLGFHPVDSCVVMGLSGSSVEFCARMELDWFATHFDQIASQVVEASSQIPDCRFVLIAYGDPDIASLSVVEMAGVVGEHRVVESLVSDGAHYWSMTDGEEGHGYSFRSTALAAQAVYEGVRICDDRAEAVAPVERWEPRPWAEEEAVEGRLAAVPDAGLMDMLASLVEGPPPGTDDALTIAVLLADDDRAAAVLMRLNKGNAEQMWENLAAVRRVATPRSEANIVALLGVASWLCGRGAAQTSCLEQLARLDPSHPIGGLLASVHQHGIPPRRWDE